MARVNVIQELHKPNGLLEDAVRQPVVVVHYRLLSPPLERQLPARWPAMPLIPPVGRETRATAIAEDASRNAL
jgi:hypothetical protein